MNLSQTLQAITPEQYVYLYRNLPEFLMIHRHGLYFDGCSEKEDSFVNKTRERYWRTALWLEYYLLKQTECFFEANLKPQIYYKPFAELQMEYLKLAEEVYLRSADAQINYPSPLSWLFLIQNETCEVELQNSGYLGSKPISLGKSEAYKKLKAACDNLNEVKAYQFTNSRTEVTPREHLLQNALIISQTDVKFRNDYWETFLKSQKRFYRNLRDSPLCVAFISEGKTEIKSNGKRGKKKKNRKSFDEL